MHHPIQSDQCVAGKSSAMFQGCVRKKISQIPVYKYLDVFISIILNTYLRTLTQLSSESIQSPGGK